MKIKNKPTEKINETKIWFCKNINKTYKPLAKLTKKNKRRLQIFNIRNERETNHG